MFDESFFEMYNAEEESESKGEGTATAQVQATTVEFDPSKVFVVSVGGSVIVDEKPATTWLAKFSESVKILEGEGCRFVFVAGGGKVARSYISAAKALGSNTFNQDVIGIAVSRINALLLTQAFPNAHAEVVTKIEHTRHIIDSGKIPILGGMLPGITTDAVAAMTAEFLDATFVNITNVDGVYSSDPNENPRAKFYPEISYEKLLSLMRLHSSKPGQNFILDIPACLIIKRSKIPTLVISGHDFGNFESAIRGNEFKGTIVGDFDQEEEK